jgi:hypothetical protein
MEANEGIDLVYGRNIRLGTFSEPARYTFSIPGKDRRYRLGLSDLDCMDIATFLYTSSEPFWGLYRTEKIKEIPIINSYGNDHFIVSAIALRGGVTGIMQPFRKVSNETRSLEDLRKSQVQLMYSGTIDMALLPPINHTNFISLAHTYFQGIKSLANLEICNSISRTLRILIKRFGPLIYAELRKYTELHSKLSAEYPDMPNHMALDVNYHHQFICRVLWREIKDELMHSSVDNQD